MRSTPFTIRIIGALAVLLVLLLARPASPADPQAAPDVPKLVEQLQSTDPIIRLKAAKTLGSLGPAAQPAIPALQKLLDDPDEDVRAIAKSAIQKIQSTATADPGEIKKLIEQLNSPDALVRLKAARALGEKGPAAQTAVESLKKLLQDPDEDVRTVAASALKKISPANGASTGSTTTPDPKDVELKRVLSLFCKGYSDNIGLASYPSRRFFLVTFRNNAKTPVKVNSVKLSWLDQSGKQVADSENITTTTEILLPGAEATVCFRAECTDAARKWTLAVEHVTPQPLPENEIKDLEQHARHRQRMKIVSAKPLRDPNLGMHVGDAFTIRNPEARVAKGVRITLFGYDRDGQLVRILVYYAARLPDGDTTLESNPANFDAAERFRTTVELEDLADSAKKIEIMRYEGEILAVGAAPKEK